MTTKATRDVIDLSIRPIHDFILDGTGTSSIDGTPIGTTTPDVGFFTNVTTNNFSVSTVADFTGANVIGLQSYYADIAELYEADEPIEPGSVVKIGGTKEITMTTEDADVDTFGIVTTAPAFIMNAQPHPDDKHMLPVVMVGRVPCRVTGPVTKGCRLVATVGGVARAMDTIDAETVTSFARSLVDDSNTHERVIEVAMVTVK